MLEVRLSAEERDLILAMIEIGLKASGAHVFREGAGNMLQSAFSKLINSKEVAPDESGDGLGSNIKRPAS